MFYSIEWSRELVQLLLIEADANVVMAVRKFNKDFLKTTHAEDEWKSRREALIKYLRIV